MAPDPIRRPQLSYVLAATSAAEVHHAAAWLRRVSLSTPIEIVLAAPGAVFAWVAARAIPPRVRLASAIGPGDRRSVRVAGARATTGLVVVVIDCDQDLDSKFNDPFAVGGQGTDLVDPSSWVDPSQADAPQVGVVSQLGSLPQSPPRSPIAR